MSNPGEETKKEEEGIVKAKSTNEEAGKAADEVTKAKSVATEPESPKAEAAGEDDAAKRTASKKSLKKGKRHKNDRGSLESSKIGFLGSGKMAEAIVKGLILSKLTPSNIFVASKNGKTHDIFKQLGVNVHKRIFDIFGKNDCDIIFIAFHGHSIRECFVKGGQRPMALATNYIPNRTHPYYILSLVGGVSIEDVKKVLLSPDHPDKYKAEFHRIVLNYACSLGLGLGAIDAEIDSKKVAPIIRDILVKIAKIEFFPEVHMDIVCSVGGTGLAYIYYFISALSDGGFKMGLPKRTADRLACKTLNSAAASVLESGKSPQDLRDMATAASGPTIFGLASLEKKDCASGIAHAVEASFKRIRELVHKHLNA